MKTYGLYLSTLSSIKPPSGILPSKSSAKWLINWREIFANRTGECRVRARLISSSATTGTITWSAGVGSLRVSLNNNSAQTVYGLNLGCIRPQSDFTAANFAYIELDTTTSNGISCIIPNSNGELTISLLDKAENLMTVAQDYQLWLYFDVDDENPYSLADKPIDNPVPQFYLPR